MPDNSILRMTGVGVPPYSARGLTQTLQPISLATAQRRTINGALRDISDPLFQKFSSTISGDDVGPPAVDGVWPGRTVQVDCIVELALLGSGATTEITGDLARQPVEGSIRQADGFIFYRPRITFMVVGWNMEADEWAAGVNWSLNLEEV